RRLIRRLHKGADIEVLKEEFKQVVAEASGPEISQLEEELIREGVPRDEVHRLCDLHLEVFRESLDRTRLVTPPGHPIHILMEEHSAIQGLVDERREIAKGLLEKIDSASTESMIDRLNHIAAHLETGEKHYQREENVLFPYLEKHGVAEPPAIMWIEHDKIRELKKRIRAVSGESGRLNLPQFRRELDELSVSVSETISKHFYKENNILFPTALKVIPQNEWREIREQFDEIGYCSFTPGAALAPLQEAAAMSSEQKGQERIAFETGSLSAKEIEAIFDTLPVDVTFVDKEDTVRYFNKSKDRIFIRTKAVLGRKVQQCHPQKSVHIVNRLLDELKSGRRVVGDFWINLEGKYVYIRYFPVKDKDGAYLGCLEVTQDIAPIKKIEGERRLLDMEK
ncbi:MAG: DUF438 domain-containing protein, partial [Candidatus Bathyarchaeia archaeon]